MSRRVEIILGPTASGKSAYAVRRALELGSPVISCDSRQIFKEMSIGTAVPSKEDLAAVKHYFIQTVPVADGYTAGQYENDALELVERLFAEGHEHLVMCGGSMMYIDAFCYGLDDFPDVPMQIRRHLMDCLESEGVDVLAQQLKEADPETWAVTDLSNGHRIVRALEVTLYTGKPYSSFKTHSFKERDFEIVKTGLDMPREQLYERINARVLKMMDAGLEEAVPDFHCVFHGCIELKTVFSSVAGTAEDKAFPLVFHVLEGVEAKFGRLLVAKDIDNGFLRLRALDCNLADSVRRVVQPAVIASGLLLNPGKVLFYVGGVHHQKEMVLEILTVHQKVIYRAAVRIAHHAVENLPGVKTTDFVGEDVVYKSLCIGAFHKDFPHVGNIEHAHVFTHGKVLLHYSRILDGHDKACKRAHLCPKGNMRVIQASFQF